MPSAARTAAPSSTPSPFGPFWALLDLDSPHQRLAKSRGQTLRLTAALLLAFHRGDRLANLALEDGIGQVGDDESHGARERQLTA